MAIRRRKDIGTYEISLYYEDREGNRRRFRRTVGKNVSKKQAEKLERKLRKQFERAVNTANVEMTVTPGIQVGPIQPVPVVEHEKSAAFSGFCHHWYKTYCVANNKPSELRAKEMIIRVHLIPYFGDQDLREIDAEQIHGFIALKKAQKLTPKSINNRLGVLRTMFKAAVEWGYLERHPMDGIKAMKDGVKEFAFFSPDETEDFLSAAEKQESDTYAFFLMAFRTGMRLGELFELRWKDVDLDRQMIHVRRSVHKGHITSPKSGRGRDIAMTDKLVEVLTPMKGAPSDLVFKAAKGKHFTRDMVKRPFWRVCEHAGLREIKLHEMRHSFASQLVMRGVHLQVVQELLGHSDIRMTMRYSHLAPDQHHDAVALLEPKSGHVLGPDLGPKPDSAGMDQAKYMN